MTTKRTRGGFTLIELLVAVGLMVILISSVVMIFNASVQTQKICEARMKIQNNARAAMDHLQRDLSSMLPMDGGSQRFWLRDDAYDPTATTYMPMPLNDPTGGRHTYGACDSIGFRTVTSVNGVLLPVQVIYRLVEDRDKALAMTQPKVVNGQIQGRRHLYVFRKEILNLDGTNVVDPTTGRAIKTMDLCYYVTAFNIEYMHRLSDDTVKGYDKLSGQFSQIAPDDKGTTEGPFPGPPTTFIKPSILDPLPASAKPRNPMGEPDGASEATSTVKNDIQVVPGTGNRYYPAFIVPALRVTLRIVEDVDARQERVYSRVIWLPTG